ncbi:MAG: nicotinamidase-related amidase [Planctomycetota bacterium]
MLYDYEGMSTARETTRQGEAFFRITPNKAALLIIDMQNGFLEPGAMLEVPAGRDIIPNIVNLMGECRKLNVPVIWVQLDSSAPYGGLLLDKYPPLRDEQVLYKGTHSFELFASVPQPEEGDFHIVKHKYDAFHGTDLDTLLRNIGIDTIIIAGVTTNCCCESTARSAFEHDYKVAFTSDGTAAFEKRLHDATLGSIRELFGRVLTIDDVITELNEK